MNRSKSPFKRKGSKIQGSGIKNKSKVSVTKKHSMIGKEEFGSQLANIEGENKNILGSLVDEQNQPAQEEQPSEILKRVEESENYQTQRESRIKSNLRSNTRSIEPREKGQSRVRESGMRKKDNVEKVEVEETEQPPVEDEEEEVEQQPLKSDNLPQKIKEIIAEDDNYKKTKNISFTNFEKYGAKEEQEEVEAAKDWPKHQKAKELYGENKGVILTILTLKKLVKTLDDENTVLKKKNLDFTIREVQYKTMIKSLAARLEELELENRLVNERPSEHIKFDIEDLDSRLKVMDDNLQKATGENSQEQFLDDVVSKNKEFVGKSTENTHAMRKLKDHLGQLKTTLMNVNAR